jgi:hypothetical protein
MQNRRRPGLRYRLFNDSQLELSSNSYVLELQQVDGPFWR